jgi:hypothetical protein
MLHNAVSELEGSPHDPRLLRHAPEEEATSKKDDHQHFSELKIKDQMMCEMIDGDD